MKRLFPLMLVVLMAPLLPQAFGSSQADPEPEDVGTQGPERDVPRQADRNRDELQYLEQLRRAMLSQLNLDDEQLVATREIFKDRTAEVEAYYAEKRRNEENNRQRMDQLEKELREARQTDDQEAVRDLFEEMRQLRGDERELNRGRREFHEALANELNEEQQQKFQQIIQSLRRDQRGAHSRLRGIRDIRRATQSLNLDQDQQRAVRQHLIETMRAIGQAGNDEEKLGELQETLQQKIIEELTPEQADQFRAKLEQLRQQPEASRPAGGRPHPRNLTRPPRDANDAGDEETEDQPDDTESDN